MLPLNYTSEILVHFSPNLSADTLLLKLLETRPEQTTIAPNQIQMGDVLGIKTKISVSVNSTHSHAAIRYKIHLTETVLISLLILITGLFLHLMGNREFGVASVVLSAAFYIVNVIVLNAKFTRHINAITARLQNQEDADLWDLQQKWLNTPNVCPACGEPENPYSKYCTQCGIKLSDKKAKSSNTSASANQDFNYQYTKDA